MSPVDDSISPRGDILIISCRMDDTRWHQVALYLIECEYIYSDMCHNGMNGDGGGTQKKHTISTVYLGISPRTVKKPTFPHMS